MRSLLIVLVALVAAGPVAAIDLTGTWQQTGRSGCTLVADDGTRSKQKDVHFSSIEITESGAHLNLRFLGTAYLHEGYVLTFGPKSIGQGLVNRCLPGLTGVSSWQMQSATTFPPDRNGVSGRLVFTYVDANDATVQFCRVTFVRTATANPAVPGCP